MRINHNISALNTYRQMGANQTAASKNMEKLSSGLKINRAGDDAAGLAISEKMRGQIRGLDMASKNAQDGISLIQTAEGALNETHSILQRMRELAVQAGNDTNTDSDRSEIQKEVEQLKTEITRISTDTEFNTKKLLNGDMGKLANKSAGVANLSNLQVTGADISNGTYNITLTDAGADTFTASSGDTVATTNSITAAMDVTAGAQIKYGDYTFTVSDYDGNAQTATYELIGPDGEKTVKAGQTITGTLSIGGIDIDLDAADLTGNGTTSFELSKAGLELDMTGDKAVNGAAFNYTGGKINFGGFEFELTTNSGTVGEVATLDVTDKSVFFQIGANSGQTTTLSIGNMSATALGVNDVSVTNRDGADVAITKINDAIEKVSSERSKLGATQNRLEHTINNLGTSSENLTAAESRIRDVDMAKEMMEMTKNNILQQAAQAMLAQANQQPQGVLQLLR